MPWQKALSRSKIIIVELQKFCMNVPYAWPHSPQAKYALRKAQLQAIAGTPGH